MEADVAVAGGTRLGGRLRGTCSSVFGRNTSFNLQSCLQFITNTASTSLMASPTYRDKPIRWAKTLFFLLTMLLSLLVVCAPPLLVAVLDVVIPSAILSASSRAAYSATAPALATEFSGYSFRESLVDVPIISAARSLLIICVYVACDGRGPYMWITTACSFLSVGYVSAKAATMYGRWRTAAAERGGAAMIEVLFVASLALAIAHIVVAYRTSCRERRKLIVYKIDIEAVSAYHNDFPSYHKIGLSK